MQMTFGINEHLSSAIGPGHGPGCRVNVPLFYHRQYQKKSRTRNSGQVAFFLILRLASDEPVPVPYIRPLLAALRRG
jgi:hypothetical protein